MDPDNWDEYEERAAIMEYDGGLTHEKAEAGAWKFGQGLSLKSALIAIVSEAAPDGLLDTVRFPTDALQQAEIAEHLIYLSRFWISPVFVALIRNGLRWSDPLKAVQICQESVAHFGPSQGGQSEP